MSAKHTPGPWVVTRVTKPVRHWTVEIPGDHPFAIGRDGGPDDVHEQDAANARLIAAAPDMLEALKEVEREMDAVIHGTVTLDAETLWDVVSRAIAKAEGSR